MELANDTGSRLNESENVGTDLIKAFQNITDHANECTSLISALRRKMESGDISTDKVVDKISLIAVVHIRTNSEFMWFSFSLFRASVSWKLRIICFCNTWLELLECP